MKNFSKKYFYIPLLVSLYLLTTVCNYFYQSPKEESQGSFVDGEVQSSEIQETQTVQEETDIYDKKVVLSFDDGPGAYTEELLDGLKERNVKANFFVVGKNICEYQDVIARMAAEGHLIGNHTYTHVQLNCLSEEEAKSEIEKTNELIEKITGDRPDFIRPPYGEYSNALKRDIDMFVALWNIDPLDWKSTDVDGMVKKVLEEVDSGDVILFHDIYKTSVEAALRVVDELLRQGYEFVEYDALVNL